VDGDSSTGIVNATVADSVAANNLIGLEVASFPGKAATILMVVRSQNECRFDSGRPNQLI
jgi:hypothetical protein